VIEISLVRGKNVITVKVTLREMVPASNGVEFDADGGKAG